MYDMFYLTSNDTGISAIGLKLCIKGLNNVYSLPAFSMYIVQSQTYLETSVADPGRFFSDPDLDPRIRF